MKFKLQKSRYFKLSKIFHPGQLDFSQLFIWEDPAIISKVLQSKSRLDYLILNSIQVTSWQSSQALLDLGHKGIVLHSYLPKEFGQDYRLLDLLKSSKLASLSIHMQLIKKNNLKNPSIRLLTQA